MPQIQVLDNPYQNVMGQATQGIAGLTNAASELEKRRAMEWQRIKDLPENSGIGQLARERFAKDTGLVASPGIIDSIIGYFRDDPSKGLASFTAKPSSAIERAGAGVQQVSSPATSTSEREYDPSRVSKQTLEMLGGDAETLSRGRSGPIGNPSASISRGANGEESYSINNRPVDAEEYSSTLAAEAAMDGGNDTVNHIAEDMQSRAGGKLPAGFLAWTKANNMGKLSLEDAQKVYYKNAAEKAVTAGLQTRRSLSDLARENGPVVYDDASARPQPTITPTPIASQSPAARLMSQSSRQAQSMRGNPAFFSQGTGLSKEEMDAIDSLSGQWDSNQRAMARELAFAGTIPDEGKKSAAKQYISNKYGRQLAPYDNGVDKPNVSMSESYGNSQSNGGGGGGGGAGSLEGFIPVNSGDAGTQWVKIRRLPENSRYDQTTRALYSMLSTTGANDNEIAADMRKVAEMAKAGDAGAKELLSMAAGDHGGKFINSKIYSSKEANYKLEPGTGILASNLSALAMRIRDSELYDGPDTKVSTDGSVWDTPVKKGQYYSSAIAQRARKKTGTVSGAEKEKKAKPKQVAILPLSEYVSNEEE